MSDPLKAAVVAALMAVAPTPTPMPTAADREQAVERAGAEARGRVELLRLAEQNRVDQALQRRRAAAAWTAGGAALGVLVMLAALLRPVWKR